MKIVNLLLITAGFIFGSLLFTQQAEAQTHQGGNFGIGVILGEPTGITPKVWTGQTTAFAGAIAWSFSGNATMHLHLDYQIHNFNLVHVNRGAFGIYYGIGGRVLIRENRDSKIGVRIPIGINYLFPNDPIELFLEVAPILDLAPDTEFTGNSGFGIRYYF